MSTKEAKDLAAQVNDLNEEDKSEFDMETHNEFAFDAGINLGTQFAATDLIIGLLSETEDLSYWESIQNSVDEWLEEQKWMKTGQGPVADTPDKASS